MYITVGCWVGVGGIFPGNLYPWGRQGEEWGEDTWVDWRISGHGVLITKTPVMHRKGLGLIHQQNIFILRRRSIELGVSDLDLRARAKFVTPACQLSRARLTRVRPERLNILDCTDRDDSLKETACRFPRSFCTDSENAGWEKYCVRV